MNNTVHTKKVTALAAAIAAAVAMTLAVGSASAAPIKNSQRFCEEKAGGSFVSGSTQYECTGNDPTGEFAFFKGAMGQCVHSFKGGFSTLGSDPASGNWRYTCILQ